MGCSIADLRNKEVICRNDGTKLGNVDDVEIDICTGKVDSIIIYGRGRFLGIAGKCSDVLIPWCDIDVIGDDTILVNCSGVQSCVPPPPPKRKKGLF